MEEQGRDHRRAGETARCTRSQAAREQEFEGSPFSKGSGKGTRSRPEAAPGKTTCRSLEALPLHSHMAWTNLNSPNSQLLAHTISLSSWLEESYRLMASAKANANLKSNPIVSKSLLPLHSETLFLCCFKGSLVISCFPPLQCFTIQEHPDYCHNSSLSIRFNDMHAYFRAFTMRKHRSYASLIIPPTVLGFPPPKILERS